MRLSTGIDPELRTEYADYQAGDTGSGKVDSRKFWVTLIFTY